jgi:hypothetical protein
MQQVNENSALKNTKRGNFSSLVTIRITLTEKNLTLIQ